MATGKMRSSEGCWTCRLRRKKCDETRPLCDACATLEIECLYSDEKPEWMETAETQKDRAEWLKLEVKRKAAERRERRYLQAVELGIESLEFSHRPDRTRAGSDSGRKDTPDASTASSAPSSSAKHPDPVSETSRHADSSQASPFASLTPPSTADGDTTSKLPMDDRELNLLVVYLDYVFPSLFPLYRPRLTDAGRGWLLVLFTRNKALLHTALSVASLFLNIVYNHGFENPVEPCKLHNWDELQKQQELALRELQAEMQAIMTRGVRGYLAETTRVLASIIQLLTVEVGIANTGSWVMHLNAATELFTMTMQEHGNGADMGASAFPSLLVRLGWPGYPYGTPFNHPWTPDQASLRFSTAFALLFDTVAATTLEQEPRLRQWHRHLLGGLDEETRNLLPPETEREYVLPHIDLMEYVGLQNWVVLSISEIATLDAWKKENKKNGSLSVAQLVTRAARIEQDIREHMAADEMTGLQDTTPTMNANKLLEYLQPTTVQPVDTLRSRIWAQAALTYLNVVVSGWQPACEEIRTSVAITIQLLLQLKAPGYLWSLIWPFTITGCMAAPHEEQTFRDLVAAMGPLVLFGTSRKALSIMEHVWENRVEVEEHADQWDYAACFRCLGHSALLV
ncbi:fungal-specific transcription factor domain-containing protein [Podospora conica]|nr:fungal-specific transcription factor domain-containing protein [Schizothecium conicum]